MSSMDYFAIVTVVPADARHVELQLHHAQPLCEDNSATEGNSIGHNLRLSVVTTREVFPENHRLVSIKVFPSYLSVWYPHEVAH